MEDSNGLIEFRLPGLNHLTRKGCKSPRTDVLCCTRSKAHQRRIPTVQNPLFVLHVAAGSRKVISPVGDSTRDVYCGNETPLRRTYSLSSSEFLRKIDAVQVILEDENTSISEDLRQAYQQILNGILKGLNHLEQVEADIKLPKIDYHCFVQPAPINYKEKKSTIKREPPIQLVEVCRGCQNMHSLPWIHSSFHGSRSGAVRVGGGYRYPQSPLPAIKSKKPLTIPRTPFKGERQAIVMPQSRLPKKKLRKATVLVPFTSHFSQKEAVDKSENVASDLDRASPNVVETVGDTVATSDSHGESDCDSEDGSESQPQISIEFDVSCVKVGSNERRQEEEEKVRCGSKSRSPKALHIENPQPPKERQSTSLTFLDTDQRNHVDTIASAIQDPGTDEVESETKQEPVVESGATASLLSLARARNARLASRSQCKKRSNRSPQKPIFNSQLKRKAFAASKKISKKLTSQVITENADMNKEAMSEQDQPSCSIHIYSKKSAVAETKSATTLPEASSSLKSHSSETSGLSQNDQEEGIYVLDEKDNSLPKERSLSRISDQSNESGLGSQGSGATLLSDEEMESDLLAAEEGGVSSPQSPSGDDKTSNTDEVQETKKRRRKRLPRRHRLTNHMGPLSRYFKGRKSSQDQDAESDEEKNIEDQSIIDFAAKFCIVSPERLHQYEKSFAAYATEQEGLRDQQLEAKISRTSQQEKLIEDYEKALYSCNVYERKLNELSCKREEALETLRELEAQLAALNDSKFADPKIALLEKDISSNEEQVQKFDEKARQLSKKHFQVLQQRRCLEEELRESGLSDPDLERVTKVSDFLVRKFSNLENKEINVNEMHSALKKLGISICQREILFVQQLLQLPKDGKLSFKTFCIVAALSERVAALDYSIKAVLEQLDLVSLGRKLDKCKELFNLLVESNSNRGQRSRVASIEDLTIEMAAGGLSEDQQRSVIDKMISNETGVIDFLDFTLYVPLFMMIHDQIVAKPLD